MTDFSGIPRAFDVREAKRAREEEARKREQATSARNTSSTTIGAGGRLDVVGGNLTITEGGDAVVKGGGSFRVEGGGSMDIVDDGELTVTGQGIAPFTDEPTISKLKFGNRLALHTWTGYEFLQPGIYLEGDEPEPLLDTPRLTGAINGDGLITRSGRRQSDGRPANIKEQSSSMCTPWAATMGTLRYDSLINSDGEDGLAGREVDSSFSTMPGVATGMVEDVLNQRAYSLNLSADAAMATSGKTGAILSIASWHMSPASGWIRVDDGGLIDIQATLGAKTVGITSLVPGKLQLAATDGVNVQGAFTINGSPVGGAVSSVAGKTGAVTLDKGDVGLGNVDNTSDASKPVATALVNGLMPSTDKSKIDGSTPSATAFRMVQRDSLGRAKFTDPAVAADAATKGYVDAADAALVPLAYAALSPAGWTATGVLTKSKNSLGDAVNLDFNLTRTGGTLALTTAWTNIGVVIPPELLPPSGAAHHRYGFAFLAGFNVQIKMFVNAANGQVSLSTLTGTQNIPATNQVFIVTSWPYT